MTKSKRNISLQIFQLLKTIEMFSHFSSFYTSTLEFELHFDINIRKFKIKKGWTLDILHDNFQTLNI